MVVHDSEGYVNGYDTKAVHRVMAILILALLGLGGWGLDERSQIAELRKDNDRLEDSLFEQSQETRRVEEQLATLRADIPRRLSRTTERAYRAGALSVCNEIYTRLAIIVSTEDGNALSYEECRFFLVP